MVEQWRDYANGLAGWYWNRSKRWGTLDDFKAEAVLGLWEAARRFQPSKGFQFSTYATYWVKQCMQRYKQKAIGAPSHWLTPDASAGDKDLLSKVLRKASLSAPIGRGDKTGILADTVAAKVEDKPCFPEDFWDRVNKWLQPRLQQVIELRYREGMILEEVGEVMGITRERVRQLEAKALAMIDRRVDFGDCLDQFQFRGTV